jgi:hypothetical protein
MRQEGMSYTFMPTAYIGGEDRLGRPCLELVPWMIYTGKKTVAGV